MLVLQMLNLMHARHIIFRFLSVSPRSDQLNFFLLIGERFMRSRWLVEWRWNERSLKHRESKQTRKRWRRPGLGAEALARWSLVSSWESCWESCWSVCMHSNFRHLVVYSYILFSHSSVRPNNSLWRCFWHDSVFHAS